MNKFNLIAGWIKQCVEYLHMTKLQNQNLNVKNKAFKNIKPDHNQTQSFYLT